MGSAVIPPDETIQKWYRQGVLDGVLQLMQSLQTTPIHHAAANDLPDPRLGMTGALGGRGLCTHTSCAPVGCRGQKDPPLVQRGGRQTKIHFTKALGVCVRPPAQTTLGRVASQPSRSSKTAWCSMTALLTGCWRSGGRTRSSPSGQREVRCAVHAEHAAPNKRRHERVCEGVSLPVFTVRIVWVLGLGGCLPLVCGGGARCRRFVLCCPSSSRRSCTEKRGWLQLQGRAGTAKPWLMIHCK